MIYAVIIKRDSGIGRSLLHILRQQLDMEFQACAGQIRNNGILNAAVDEVATFGEVRLSFFCAYLYGVGT